VSRRALRGGRGAGGGGEPRISGGAKLLAATALALALALTVGSSASCRGEAPVAAAPQTIRCAVIGGMVETGLWAELAARFTRLTGHRVEVTSVGPKPMVVGAFRQGGIDLVTVHASDAMVNLVADGLAVDPQPWARNDFLIVGPASDPAKIRGQKDALAAMRAIVEAKAPVVINASQGADGVMHDLMEAGKLSLAAEAMVPFGGADQRGMLALASARGAYAFVGRIPFVNGKIPRQGLEIMVQGDPRLRRPYLVAVANEVAGGAGGAARLAAARELAAFLRSPATQEWLAAFGKGRYDDDALFFPVTVPAAR
jgi:tungstate transport system substrate-binding protein